MYAEPRVKRLLVLWTADERTRSERRSVLLARGMPALLKAGAEQLSVLIADEHAAVRSPSPFPLRGRKPVAMVNLWGAVPEAVAMATALNKTSWRIRPYRPLEHMHPQWILQSIVPH